MNRVKLITQEQADEIYRRLPKSSKFIFAIGMETGLRISDILQLRNSDVANSLRAYVSRLDTVRDFPISDWLHNELINRYGYQYPARYIFPGRSSPRRPIHRTTYHRHIKTALDGLDFDASAHSTRKFYLNDLAALRQCNSTETREEAANDRELN